MKINEITEDRIDEVIPAVGAVGGALARGAAAAGGALARGAGRAVGAAARGIGQAATNAVGQAMGAPEDDRSPEAMKAKAEQKKQIQAQIKATQDQLRALQQQLQSIR